MSKFTDLEAQTNILTSLFAIMLTVLVTCDGGYTPVLAQYNACFDPATSYGATSWTAPQDGTIEGIKLKYKSGTSTCDTQNSSIPLVRWGCEPYGIFVFLVAITPVLITQGKGPVWYPTHQTKNVTFERMSWWDSNFNGCSEEQYYFLNGNRTGYQYYDEILLHDPANKHQVQRHTQTFALQWSEALCDAGSFNGGGRQCADVYFLYSDPSPAPTNSPSAPPTAAPVTPSQSPSHAPSMNPSYAPTTNPTLPSLSPSQSPSINPSYSPTVGPTANPSQAPSQASFQAPTDDRTNAHVPSIEPTASPSQSPTSQSGNNPDPECTCYNFQIIIYICCGVFLLQFVAFVIFIYRKRKNKFNEQNINGSGSPQTFVIHKQVVNDTILAVNGNEVERREGVREYPMDVDF